MSRESRVRGIDFKNGQTNVHNVNHTGRPSLHTDELVMKINDLICETCLAYEDTSE